MNRGGGLVTSRSGEMFIETNYPIDAEAPAERDVLPPINGLENEMGWLVAINIRSRRDSGIAGA